MTAAIALGAVAVLKAASLARPKPRRKGQITRLQAHQIIEFGGGKRW